MEIIKGSIYDWPKYYEFIYGSDWQAECDFLRDCFGFHADGEVQRLFEPACGTGRLIYRLAKRGFEVGGVDLNPEAIRYCQERFEKAELQADVFVGDMCDFACPNPWDAAFNTINSFRHLLSDELAIRHLRCVAQCLRPGGIYVLGLHLTPTACVPQENETWSHRRGHLQVNASMWLVSRDPPNRSETFALAFDVFTPSRQFRIQDEFQFRTYTVSQFESLLQEVPEFTLAETYDFAYDSPIELDGSTEDVVFILKRAAV